jgi:hypothetical protein
MGRAYNVIDADGHVLEPFFLWDEYMDPAYRKCGPKMVIDANGKERLWLQNKILGNALGLGRLFAPASPGAQPPPRARAGAAQHGATGAGRVQRDGDGEDRQWGMLGQRWCGESWEGKHPISYTQYGTSMAQRPLTHPKHPNYYRPNVLSCTAHTNCSCGLASLLGVPLPCW